MTKTFGWLDMGLITNLVLSVLKSYKIFVSPYLPVSCRHIPTCSEYSHGSISKYGLGKGSLMTAKRILRCRPLGTSGYDPVP